MKDDGMNSENELKEKMQHRQSSLAPYDPLEAGSTTETDADSTGSASGLEENKAIADSSVPGQTEKDAASDSSRSGPTDSSTAGGRRFLSRGHAGIDYDSGNFHHAGSPHRAPRTKKGFPWGPAFGIYICVMLVGALLSGHLGRNKTGLLHAGQQSPIQTGGPADNGGSSGGETNPQGASDPEDEVEIGDTFYASDADRLNRQAANDQQGPAAEQAVDPQRIEVESISISADTTWMRQGERVQMSAAIVPENATDQAITWRTSDETVAKISPSGAVTSVGGGDVVISATTSNGLVVEYPMQVSMIEKRMLLDVTRSNDYNDSVGDDWDFEYSVNGETVSAHEEIIVVLGDTVTVSTEITEDDETPDVGITEGSYTIDSEGFANGFQMQQEVIVQENEGEYEGNEASFTVTYTFSNVGQ